jgi:hypothetical protein
LAIAINRTLIAVLENYRSWRGGKVLEVLQLRRHFHLLQSRRTSVQPFSHLKEPMVRSKTKRAARAMAALAMLVLLPAVVLSKDLAGRVNIVPPRDRGQTAVARLDEKGIIHLLSDAADGPWYFKSTDGGTTFSTPLAVVDERARKPGLEFSVSDMAVGKDGRVHVVMSTNAWKLKLARNEWGAFYTSIDPHAQAISPVRSLNQTPSEGFSVACDDRGTVTVCWLKDKLYANLSRDHGDTFAAAVEINPACNPCNCCTTSAVYGTDGRLAVLYREESDNNRDMFLLLWDQDRGQSSVERISSTSWNVSACPMTYYAVARDQSGFSAVWPTRGDVYFARLDGRGKALAQGEIKTPGKAGMRTGMLILNANDGSVLVAWKKDHRLGWQLYDAAGSPLGSSGSAASPGAGAAGVVDKHGQFLLFR